MKISATITTLALLALSACQFSYDKAQVEDGYGSGGESTCVSGVADATYSTISGTSGIPANNTAYSTVTVTLLDCNSMPVVSQTVTIDAVETGTSTPATNFTITDTNDDAIPSVASGCTETILGLTGVYECRLKTSDGQIVDVNLLTPIAKSSDPLSPIEFQSFINLNAKICLEGAFGEDASNNLEMSVAQNSLIPTSTPYSAPPWNLSVSESGVSIGPDFVDWVAVQLFDSTGTTQLATQSALLHKDGSLWSTSGTQGLSFTNVSQAASGFHLNIIHRNHVASGTHSPVLLSDDTIAAATFDLDLTTVDNYKDSEAANPGAGKYPFKTLGSGHMCLGAGDLDYDQIVAGSDSDVFDHIFMVIAANFACPGSSATLPNMDLLGYRLSDVTLDGHSTACDPTGLIYVGDRLILNNNSGSLTSSSKH
jgi:hypothetical protein